MSFSGSTPAAGSGGGVRASSLTTTATDSRLIWPTGRLVCAMVRSTSKLVVELVRVLCSPVGAPGTTGGVVMGAVAGTGGWLVKAPGTPWMVGPRCCSLARV